MTKQRITVFILGICSVIFALMGILLLSQGVSGPEIQEESTLETTAIVSDTELKTKYYFMDGAMYKTTEFYVYLDFSSSRIDAKLVDLLSQQKQGIRLHSREALDHFYVGKHVSVVYHTLESGHTYGGNVAINSVDGYQPSEGVGDLTTPRFEEGENIAVIAIGGFCLALGLAFLVMVLYPRIRAKVWTFLSEVLTPFHTPKN